MPYWSHAHLKNNQFQHKEKHSTLKVFAVRDVFFIGEPSSSAGQHASFVISHTAHDLSQSVNYTMTFREVCSLKKLNFYRKFSRHNLLRFISHYPKCFFWHPQQLATCLFILSSMSSMLCICLLCIVNAVNVQNLCFLNGSSDNKNTLL